MEKVRKLRLGDELAQLLASARNRLDVESVYPPTVEAIEEVEDEFECTIPDPVLAFYAAGLAGIFNRRMESPRAMLELTRSLQGEIEELRDTGLPVSWSPTTCVAFNIDQSDYVAFDRNASSNSESILYVDHEVRGEPPVRMTLNEYLKSDLDAAEDADTGFEAWVVTDPTEQSEEFVRHAKFGRGELVERRGEKWTVEFEDGETRTLLSDFLELE